MNPYQGLADHRFWRRAVSDMEYFRIDPVVSTRFNIDRADKIATAGSCFSQHITKRLSAAGFNHLVTESGEHLPPETRDELGYGIYSARYGNVYTSRQLLQLFQECFEGRKPVDHAWRREDGRYVDALRPRVTPSGFATIDEVVTERAAHVDAVRRMFLECDVFIFTLGLTETWLSCADGTAYPLAPGVSGGGHDSARYRFENLTVQDVCSDMETTFKGLKKLNPGLRAILTVSPVPLIATSEDRHVLMSNTCSKAVLRVAADMLYRDIDWVEYFPSYEIITGPHAGPRYYGGDLRNVNKHGIDHALSCFMRHYAPDPVRRPESLPTLEPASAFNDVICDEETIDRP